MKTMFLALLWASLVFGTNVACAERGDYGSGYGSGYGGGDWSGGLRHRIRETRARIERGYNEGRLSQHEAHRFQEELRDIDEDFDRVREEGGRHGSPEYYARHMARINEKINQLNAEITAEKHEHDRDRY